MSTLFPPLESVSIVRKSNTSTTMTAKASSMNNLPVGRLETDTSFENNARNNYDLDVLSPELTHNFDTLRCLLQTEPNENAAESGAEVDISSTSSCNHKRKTAEALAVETALLVEQEVAHLQNGIRELEALLVASQQRQQQAQPQTIRSNGRRRTRRRRIVDATNPSFQQQQQQQAADDLNGNQG